MSLIAHIEKEFWLPSRLDADKNFAVVIAGC